MEFYCVTFHLLVLSWITTVPHVCVLIRLHSAHLLCEVLQAMCLTMCSGSAWQAGLSLARTRTLIQGISFKKNKEQRVQVHKLLKESFIKQVPLKQAKGLSTSCGILLLKSMTALGTSHGIISLRVSRKTLLQLLEKIEEEKKKGRQTLARVDKNIFFSGTEHGLEGMWCL